MRKFTILHLEIRRLSVQDILLLAAYLLLVITTLIKDQAYLPLQAWGIPLIVFLNYILICNTLFGLRFRSIYFSSIWGILSVIIISTNSAITLIPIFLFLFYHFIRLAFWKRHDREFIPLEVLKFGEMKIRYSNIENRGGDKTDERYMTILYWGGVTLLLYTIYSIVFRN